MRPNNRTKFVEAAIRVVERAGPRALTLEATAEEAGMTRGGMKYHFADRDALLLGVCQHLADLWEQRLIAAAGKPAADATPHERLRAYVAVAVESATRAEPALTVDVSDDPHLTAPWRGVQQRWTSDPDTLTDDASPELLRLFLIRLAADGLWAYDALGPEPLSDNKSSSSHGTSSSCCNDSVGRDHREARGR